MPKNRLYSSLYELKNIRALTLCALLIAIHVLLNTFFSFYIAGVIKVSFTYIPLAIIAMLFGPVTAALAGGACEVVGYIFNSVGAYHPGFTVTTILTGFIMGLFFYKRSIKLWRIISARLIVNLFLNIGINTIWVMQTIGKAYMALLPGRLWKNLILLPIEIFLIYVVFKSVSSIKKRMGYQ